MNRHVNLFFLWFFVLISGNSMRAEETTYLRYVSEITRAFIAEMQKETGLECMGSGGSMPHDVEKIEVLFVGYRKATLEEARALEVKAIQKLIKKINEHEKIRPFLREYPFDEGRVGISISFQTNRAGYYLDGSVASVFNGRNKIFYRAAEKQLITYPPIYNSSGEIDTPSTREIEERLIPLMDEPYEEAVKIVKSISL